jgi:hypothetical protein
MTSLQMGAAQAMPSRTEKRHTAVVVTIERWQRRLEKADKTVRRAVLTLTKLERRRRRLQKRIAAEDVAKADAIVLAAIPAEREPPLEIPPFLKREDKRKRKAKAK